MRSREPINEFLVRFGEIKREKIGRFHPSEFGNLECAGLSIDDGAVKEMELHGFRRIVMCRGVRLIQNLNANPELFMQLASQRGCERFAGFDFSSREFPEIGKMRIGAPTRNEDVLVATDDCCGDGDHKG